MNRLRFEKTGDGIFLSHLDLMRVFQRAFLRAGVMLKHSRGFSPRPYVSVALPLSVGVESVRELLDFALEEGSGVPADLRERLNATLPVGVRVAEVYESDRKPRDIAYLKAELTLEYDNGIPDGTANAIAGLLTGESMLVEKHSKKGVVETDIRPMIRGIAVLETSPRELSILTTVCAQNPALNPLLLAEAIKRYLPACSPDFFHCRRTEILDGEEKPFR